MPLPTDIAALSECPQVAAVRAVERMVTAWPAFAGTGAPGEIGGSMWHRVATTDHNRVDEDAPVAIDIVHAGDLRGDGTLTDPQNGGGEVLAGIVLVVKAYLWDPAAAARPPAGSDPDLVKLQLTWLYEQICSMLERGANTFDFGADNGSPYYAVNFPEPPQPTSRYYQNKSQRYVKVVAYLDIVGRI